MIDAFIIEELKRREREEERRRESERPYLELPLPAQEEPMQPSEEEGTDQKPERGVMIIDFSV